MGSCCCKPYSKPKEDLLTNLPREMALEIIERLPIRSIIACKSVCKSWRHMIEGGLLAPSYSIQRHVSSNDVYIVCDEAFKPLLRLVSFIGNIWYNSNLFDDRVILVSVNGLLWMRYKRCNNFFICNPLNLEYVTPPLPAHFCEFRSIFGFGVSKISRRYKILCGYHGPRFWSCYVYTPGGRGGQGVWRCIEGAPGIPTQPVASFFNGNLYWLAYDTTDNLFVCCLDIETELFTSFSLPQHDTSNHSHLYKLSILEGQLCLCDMSDRLHIVIWITRGTDSWVKEYTINTPKFCKDAELVSPLRVAYGNLLFRSDDQIYIYTKSTKNVRPYGGVYYSCITYYMQNLITLRGMGFSNVKSLRGSHYI